MKKAFKPTKYTSVHNATYIGCANSTLQNNLLLQLLNSIQVNWYLAVHEKVQNPIYLYLSTGVQQSYTSSVNAIQQHDNPRYKYHQKLV